MGFERTLIISILFTSAICLIVLSCLIWNRRTSSSRGAQYFALGLAATAVYTFGYGMELSSQSLADVMFWVRIEHLGIQLITPCWVLFTLCITGYERVITPSRLLVLFAYPVFMVFATQTLGTLNLVHKNPRLDISGPFPTFTYDRGIWMYIGLAYINVCLLTCLVLYTIMVFRSKPAFRNQAILFLLASIVPFVAEFLYNIGLSPFNIDLIPFSLTISCFIFAFGYYRFQLLQIIPLARDVIFDNLKDGVLVLDNSDRIIDYNPAIQSMVTGITKTVIGKPVYDVLREEAILLDFIRGNNSGLFELEKSRDGNINTYLGNLSPLRDWNDKTVGKIITLHDNTRTKDLLTQLENLASRDSLTNVFNRRNFEQLVLKDLTRDHPDNGNISLIMMDLDNFKQINDTYGHAAGDMVLKKVIQTCQHLLRQADIPGRYGGDEFVFFLPDTDTDSAKAIAGRLLEGITKNTYQLEGTRFSISASLGVSSSMRSGKISLKELFRNADKAVYMAKQEGRNRVCVCNPEG
jgi:diguanylate cyclase (GGDEF)-like protein